MKSVEVSDVSELERIGERLVTIDLWSELFSAGFKEPDVCPAPDPLDGLSGGCACHGVHCWRVVGLCLFDKKKKLILKSNL